MQYINQRTAAEVLGVSVVTVWRYRRAGLLRTYTVAGHPVLALHEVRRLKPPKRGRRPADAERRPDGL